MKVVPELLARATGKSTCIGFDREHSAIARLDYSFYQKISEHFEKVLTSYRKFYYHMQHKSLP